MHITKEDMRKSMPHRKKKTKNNVARAVEKQKQPKIQPKKDNSKPTSLGSKIWKGVKIGFWIWNAVKRCWEFLEGDPPDSDDSDLTESDDSEGPTDSEESDADPP